jgi:hypothetical protein
MIALAAGLGLGPGSAAEGEAEKNAAAASTAKSEPPAKEQKRLDIPVPKGQPQKGLRIPMFSPDGKLLYRFEIGVAEVVDDEHVKLGVVHVESFKENGDHDFDIDLSDSVYNQKTSDLISNVQVTIKCREFELSGNSLTFNFGTKTGKLGNGVKMVIHDASAALSKEDEKHSGPTVEVKPVKEEQKR